MKDIKQYFRSNADIEAYQKQYELMQYERLVKKLREELEDMGYGANRRWGMKKTLFDKKIVDKY